MTKAHYRTTTLAATLLAALAGQAGAQDVIWWYEQATPDQQQLIADLIEAPYAEANPDETLVIDYRGNELDKQLRVAMLSGSGPDVVYTPGPSYVAPMAQSGQLLPLDDYAEQYGWNDRILPVFLEMGRYDGTLYALPKTYETLGLYYNASLFEENGWEVPGSIAELETLADEMLAKDIVPFAAGNSDWRGANEWFVSLALNAVAGPEKVYQALTGEIPWTDPAFVESIDALARWWEAGYFGDDYFSLDSGEQVAAMLAQGEAGMMPSGTWAFQNIDIYFGESGAEPGFTGFPSAEGEPVFPLGVGSTFSIAQSSDNPDGAAKVIDFIFSPGFYGPMNSAWQGEWNIPLSDLSGVEMDPDAMPIFVEAMATLATSVDEGNYGYTSWTFLPPATNSLLINGIEEVWLDRTTSEEFLAELDAQFQQEMAEDKVPAIPAR
ncbi:putative sugar-binding lipoprotein [Oceanicola granulosus HTCC2516]|uniref:sn-glycerol-3-phosphate-binding periplasmic protein UgpB n=1 Tax=Oceanicola granulosus (strain ATCC BAA-861 / DSM 15982 / KCTC 12143 / HTCC2516) TaxID=314256 RepID=Q2CHB0_OCEGH|nr:extracellular solute-binding protein [Oceanicola granulosus]EAR52129.1 putative sugar-binding lipoprotein [Oceanicola granulosus HTCC2516]